MVPKTEQDSFSYTAPMIFIGIFYFLFASFVIVTFIFLIQILNQSGISYGFAIFMFIFILLYMGYFTAGISHKVEVWNDGRLRLTSLRRTIDTKVEDIPYVEGPFLLPIGFIRFRLAREKGYLFSYLGDSSLNTVLAAMKTLDPNIRFNHLKVL